MATILYRRLSGGDPVRGAGLANFLTDLNAVAQSILTRILLLQGEWFERLDEGTPLFQSILGVAATNQGVALIMRQRILGSPFVTGIQNLQVTYTPNSRAFVFTATVQTAFGTVSITNQPAPGA